ncbi:molybdenum cofactor biosynthesis protein MoaE, partial [Methanobrevibacter smithii]
AKIKFNVFEISVIHYIGEFYTGDSLFLVAVLGGHRGESLDALKEVIEKVKYDVEFKKEEISDNGSKTILAGG